MGSILIIPNSDFSKNSIGLAKTVSVKIGANESTTVKINNVNVTFSNEKDYIGFVGYDPATNTKVNSVYVPASGTDTVIKQLAFRFPEKYGANLDLRISNATNLDDIDLSGLDGVNCVIVQIAGTKLSTIDLSKVGGEIQYLRYGFQSNSQLTEISFPSIFNTSTCTRFDWMFNGCTSLIKADLRYFDFSAATDVSSMFNGCWSMTDLNMGNFEPGTGLTTFSNMFNNCRYLSKLICNTNGQSWLRARMAAAGYLMYYNSTDGCLYKAGSQRSASERTAGTWTATTYDSSKPDYNPSTQYNIGAVVSFYDDLTSTGYSFVLS